MKITTNLPANNTALAKGGRESLTDRFRRTKNREAVMLMVDVSSSMSTPFGADGARLDAAKRAIEKIVSLSARDRTAYGLLTFTATPCLWEAVGGNFTGIIGTSKGFVADGTTRYAPALLLGLEHQVNRIIFLSDGAPYDKNDTMAAIRRLAEQGIVVDTVGIGEATDILQHMSELTGGKYTYAASAEALVKTFAQLETRARLLLEAR